MSVGQKLIPIYETSLGHGNNPAWELGICYSALVKVDWKNETMSGFGVTGWDQGRVSPLVLRVREPSAQNPNITQSA